MLLRIFQQQVALQCDFMLRAANEVNVALKSDDMDGIYYAIQNLLNAAANISKALWGQGGKLAADRQELRDSIGIDDKSLLREVTMRNHFEHFDERLDRWWNESPHHNCVDRNLGPRSMIDGVEDIDRFRNFDPVTTDLTFWGQDFNLQKIIDEVRRILPKLREEASKPHWVK